MEPPSPLISWWAPAMVYPWEGENSQHYFEFKGKRWRNVKSQNPQPQRRLRDLLLSPTHKYLDERSMRECFFAAF